MTAIYDTKTLKAGDKVNIAFSHCANVRRAIGTVKRVSPTGITTVTMGESTYVFNSDGWERGSRTARVPVAKWLETI